MAEQAAVRIEGLTVSYRRRQKLLRVLNDVSFEIGHGEAYGLVGESGCGKTTAAMALMRYLPENAVVDSGRIMFGDEDVLTASDSTLRKWRGERMAMVDQDPGSALNPSIKVGEQIAEVYRFHKHLGKSDALAAAVEMLSTVQISAPDRVARRYPHELSGGQQQRVMFAMALATDPDLLVLDEPNYRPRRDRRGRGARPGRAAAHPVQHVDPVRQPQPGNRRARLRAGGRAVRGAADRAGAGA